VAALRVDPHIHFSFTDTLFRKGGCARFTATFTATLIHRRLIFMKSTRAHTQQELICLGGLERASGVRRHCGPLCLTLVAAKSGSICIAVVSVSGEVIVLSERLVGSIYLSIHLSVCLSVYLSIYQSIYLSIHLSIYLSIHILRFYEYFCC